MSDWAADRSKDADYVQAARKRLIEYGLAEDKLKQFPALQVVLLDGHLGYEVTTCTDGSQAIAAFTKAKSHSEPFDVVMMDLVIPNGVGGQDAVHTIKKIDATPADVINRAKPMFGVASD